MLYAGCVMVRPKSRARTARSCPTMISSGWRSEVVSKAKSAGSQRQRTASAGRLRLGHTRVVRDVEVQFLAARADEGLRLSGVDPDVAGGLGPPPRGLDGAGALLFLVLRAAHLAGAGAAQFVQQRLGVIDAVAAAAAAAGERKDVRHRLPL